MVPHELLATLALVVVTSAAIASDVKSRKIPNWLTVSACLLAIVHHTFLGSWAGLRFALGGFAVGFGILFVLWLIGGGGGGDVKLMGALGAWLGPGATLIVFVLSGVCTLVLMLALQGWKAHSRTSQPALATAHPGSNPGSGPATRRMLPYAVPAGMAVWLYLVWLHLLAR